MAESAGARFDRLMTVMQTLRGPDGCPWDREQTLSSLRPFVLEETYELIDALDRDDRAGLREELGDVLFELVFIAQIASEDSAFTISEAIQSITDKLIRRHPHVFTPDGIALTAADAPLTVGAVVTKWEEIKSQERLAAKASHKTVLNGVPRALPALLRAYEFGTRAAAVGFDWPSTDDVIAKIDEEVGELRELLDVPTADPVRVEEEMGDVLFSIVNLARKLGVEPEAALRRANDKFQQRFEGVEREALSRGKSLGDLTLAEMEASWQGQK